MLRNRKLQGRRSRRAATTIELVAAIAILAACSSIVLGFVSQVRQGLRDREIAARLDWELMNVREEIASWEASSITVEKIQQLTVSQALRDSLDDCQWIANVEIMEQPIPAKQITLALNVTLRGQPAQPAILTFWVPTQTTVAQATSIDTDIKQPAETNATSEFTQETKL